MRLRAWALWLSLGAGCASEAPPADEGPPAADAATCFDHCRTGQRRCAEDGAAQTCADYDDDGCVEWGGDVVCPEETRCVAGGCAAACAHACEIGESVCGGGGVRACTVAPGGCRVLAEPVACNPGERCDDGACVPEGRACNNGCATEGDRECMGDGYRRCGRFDEDRCLEWSTSVPCPDGQTCRDGECVPGCTDECVAGETRCVAGGRAGCGQHDEDACLDLSLPTPCADDERCDEGACVPAGQACQDACPRDGDTVCESGGFRRCGHYDEDPCIDLSPIAACAQFEVCVDGVCGRGCADVCAAGARRCGAAGVETCADGDGDGCREWGAAQACPAGQRCDDGGCVPAAQPCEDACAGGARRCGAGGVIACADVDDDPCVEWAAAAPCPPGERCEGAGECVPDCVDECEAGTTACVGDGVADCGQHDADPCLDRGPAVACPANQSCSGGRCRADCLDDCDVAGQRNCGAGNGVIECGQYDADGCRDWSSPTPCGANDQCRDGACVVLCRDECEEGDRRCAGDGFETCGQYDADPCLEWGGAAACPAGRVCADGICPEPPPCDVPTAVGETVELQGMPAFDGNSNPLPCLDVVPTAAGFAVAAGSWDNMRFALTDLDGRLQAGPHILGNDFFGGWGRSDAYHPSIVRGADQFLVTWSGFSNQGNRDIYLRRLTPQGQPIAVGNMVISQRKGFNPVIAAGGPAYQVFFNAYWEVVRIDLTALGEPQMPQPVITARNGDTRENGYVDVARTPEGTLGLAHAHAGDDFGTPRARFRRLNADGSPGGNEVDLGDASRDSIRKGLHLVGLPRDRFALVWQSTAADANRTRVIHLAILNRDGVEQSRLRLNDVEPSGPFLPHLDLYAVGYDGTRLAIAHRREFPGLEPAHHAIQWVDVEARAGGRLDLGALMGFPVRHPGDGGWRVFVPGQNVRVAPLRCP